MRSFANFRLFFTALTVLCVPLTFIASSLPLAAQTAPPSEERQMLLVPGNLAELEGAVSDIRQLLEEIENADPSGGWVTKGKADYQAKLNAELSALLNTFSGEAYERTRSELVKADLAITTGEDQSDRLNSDLRLAPRGNGQLSLVDRAMLRVAASGSENEIKQELAAAEAAIDVARKARSEIIAGFTDEMAQRFGFVMLQEQATALLYHVNGHSIVQSKFFSKLSWL